LLHFEKRQSKNASSYPVQAGSAKTGIETSSNEVNFIDHRPLESVRLKVPNFSVPIADSNANTAF